MSEGGRERARAKQKEERASKRASERGRERAGEREKLQTAESIQNLKIRGRFAGSPGLRWKDGRRGLKTTSSGLHVSLGKPGGRGFSGDTSRKLSNTEAGQGEVSDPLFLFQSTEED